MLCYVFEQYSYCVSVVACEAFYASYAVFFDQMFADVDYLLFGEVFSVDWCAFCFHEVGVAVVAVVALVSGGVFAAFDYVFVFFFEVEPAVMVLTKGINLTSRSGHFIP